MDPITIILVLAILALPIFMLRNTRRSSEDIRLINKIPGPKTLPLLGNMLELARISNAEIIEKDHERYKTYGPISRTWLMNMADIHIYSAEACEILLGGVKHLEKSFAYDILQAWLGQGLLTAKGQKWHKHRKMITPTFHFKILENFFDVMVDKSNILLENLEKSSAGGKIFNVFPLITNATLDIICETAMGTNVHAQEVVTNDYVTAIYSLSELVLKRVSRPWLMIEFLFSRSAMGKQWANALKTLHDFTEQIIRERRRERKSFQIDAPGNSNDVDLDIGKKKRVAFLDLLLDVADRDSSFTDLDIRDEVDTFMFAGHDTITAGISWTIYLLGRHLEIQEKVYEELNEILNREDRPINFQDISEMKYLERVIKESLRLYPPVAGYGRKTDEEFEVHGYKIPIGANVIVHPYSMHRDIKYFPNPELFNPDNFLPDVVTERHPYAYLPFSAGPRNCIGQKFAVLEEKTVLASILRKFKITSMDKADDITLVSELILRPQSGINIILERR